MNPIERISVYYDQFSIAERKTCNLIIEDPQTVIDNPIAEAAKIYDVSTSSLLRVAKRMEYKGYSEFRYALKDWIKEDKNTHNSSNIIHIIESYKSNLDKMYSYIDEKQIIDFISEFPNSRVFTIGMGNSSLPAQQLTYFLFSTGLWSSTIMDSVQLKYLENCLSKDDLLIFFSVSGSVGSYKEIIEYCKENNIRTAMVTMNDSEYLKKSVTYYFLLPMLSIYNSNNNKNFHRIDNRSIFNIFIEILISFYTPQ